MLQVICGRDGHDPGGPPVPWRQAGPVELTGPHAAYWPGFPPWSPEESRPDRGADRGSETSSA
jgi:hypothetical protein